MHLAFPLWRFKSNHSPFLKLLDTEEIPLELHSHQMRRLQQVQGCASIVLVSDCRDMLLAAAARHGLLSTSGAGFKASSRQKSSLAAPKNVAAVSQGSQWKWTGETVHFVAREQPKATITHCHTRCSPLQTSTVPQLQRNRTYILFCSTHIHGHFFATHSFIFSLCFFFLLPVWSTWLVVFLFFFYSKETSFACDKAAGGKKAQLRQEKFYIKAQTAVVLID